MDNKRKKPVVIITYLYDKTTGKLTVIIKRITL